MIEIQFVILLCAIALFGLISAVVIGDICQAARLREELGRGTPHWTPAIRNSDEAPCRAGIPGPMKFSTTHGTVHTATLPTGKETGTQAPPRLVPVSNSATASRCGPRREVLACEDSLQRAAKIAAGRVAGMEAPSYIILSADCGSDMLLRLGYLRTISRVD
jgi:hypothetical protein